MSTVEDLIIKLSYILDKILNTNDKNLVSSFSNQILQGKGFTEKQGNYALIILRRYKNLLTTNFNTNIDNFLDNPIYKLPLRSISSIKRMSIISNAVYNKIVKVEFPFNEDYIKIIKGNKKSLDHFSWDRDKKAWIFSLTENNLLFLTHFAKTENFQLDEELSRYSNNISKILTNIENYIPMLVIDNKKLKYINISENIPELQSTDILEAVFEARKYGIFTWDENVSAHIDSEKVNPLVRSFLKSSPNEKMYINSEIYPISELSDFIKFLRPCIIIIPGGTELQKLEQAVGFLKNAGIDNDKMSVMFRLPSENGKKFNDFVKENNLNSPITNNTEVVFISSKIPKPLLKSKLKFNTVINFGVNNVHYTIKNYIANHQNVIYFSEKIENKEFNWLLQNL